MSQYDYIVVGGGISGLTAARILGLQGRSVLLVEKARTLGGSVGRFRLGGVPFDVGFHFTGGFLPDRTGVMDHMLSLLGVRDRITPIYYPRNACHRMIFPSESVSYDVPCGVEALQEMLLREFPSERSGIERYFAGYHAVIAATPALSVYGFDLTAARIDEDEITLQHMLDRLTSNRLLQAVLSGFCMCYGTSPDQVSFATHCRISGGLHESLARVEDGGSAFVDALSDALVQSGVEVRTGTGLAAVTDVVNRKARRFVLTDGTDVCADTCILTIHPQSLLQMLPEKCVSRAFAQRVGDFEPSIGFFAWYGTHENGRPGELPAITSILPGTDLNSMLTCRTPQPIDGPLVVLQSPEQTARGPLQAVSMMEVAFPQWTARWAGTQTGDRPEDYAALKAERTASIEKRVRQAMPDLASGLKRIDSATTLTFRDYLHSPDGSAYGIRQKVGQFNVLGKLPVTNLFAAGQSALLPGVMGAMASAFLVCRMAMGADLFKQFLTGASCR